MHRSDAPLILFLHKRHSPDTAKEWQHPPLVLIPDDGATQLITSEKLFANTVGTLDHLAWTDVIYDFPGGRQNLLQPLSVPGEPRGRFWIRVRRLDNALKQQTVSSPWLTGPADLLAPFRLAPDRWLIVEAWESDVQSHAEGHGFPWYPDISLIDRHFPWTLRDTPHLYPNPLCREQRAFGEGFCNIARCWRTLEDSTRIPCTNSEILMALTARMAALLTAYMVIGYSDYPVEVRPVIDPSRHKRLRKTAILKPWLREDLPHIILLDPTAASTYGHPSGGQPVTSHRSPTPHQRRGHWRTLHSTRYKEPGQRIFIKQTWVGTTQWEWEGNRYRLITAKPRT